VGPGVRFAVLAPLDDRLTTCLENLEMSGNLTNVRDFTKSQGSVREKDKCQGKVA